MSIADLKAEALCAFADLDEAAEFVRAWMDAMADHLEDEEPYATQSIEKLRYASGAATAFAETLREDYE